MPFGDAAGIRPGDDTHPPRRSLIERSAGDPLAEPDLDELRAYALARTPSTRRYCTRLPARMPGPRRRQGR